ncbi:hypothetical protein E2542_SST10709 [Spatholobus suberectus]|nr:hypothetical protein E2542_SST10709 [Spatholobus suberectus]
MTGTKDESKDSGISSATGRRKQSQAQHYYLSLGTGGELNKSSEEFNLPDDWIRSNFRLRLMYEGKSFSQSLMMVWFSNMFVLTVGNYNGSLFVVDTFGSLLHREWSDNEIAWRNCPAMRKGRNIVRGQPWDRLPGKGRRVTTEDSVFFMSKNGRLLQFMREICDKIHCLNSSLFQEALHGASYQATKWLMLRIPMQQLYRSVRFFFLSFSLLFQPV